MHVKSRRLYQAFKYTVYALLAFNVYLFFDEELAAAALQFPNGIALVDIIEAYSATIDTIAWGVLLLMFELETYVLEEEDFTRPIAWTCLLYTSQRPRDPLRYIVCRILL